MDHSRDIHSGDFFPDGRAYWHRTEITHLTGLSFSFDKFAGILDVTDYEHISVWRGACVGGGSKVFTGVMIQPEREYFEEIFADNVDYEEMRDIFYPRVKEMLNLSPLPDDLYKKSAWGHSRVWDKQARPVILRKRLMAFGIGMLCVKSLASGIVVQRLWVKVTMATPTVLSLM